MGIESETDSLEKQEPLRLTCDQCRNWRRDAVGDGTGVGRCLLNIRPFLLKWPGQTACKDIELAK
jgi:hypothetical protein